jgi:16S rRNA (guanine966-N2)-methyltransferase
MRIVGGELRGRALKTPRSLAIRPTTDRTRESLFNILAHGYPENVEGAAVLDLFAGTGAFGLEALSRGARSAVFVENSVEGRGLLRDNIEALGLQGRARILRRDATMLGSAQRLGPFNLIFADPPYGKGLGEKALSAAIDGGWMAPGALVLLEERAEIEPETPGSLIPIESRLFGETRLNFYRHAAGGGAGPKNERET